RMREVKPLLGGVELGGTKCICILGSGPDDIREQTSIPTGERDATLQRINSALDEWQAKWGRIHALGLASFGPLDLRPGSPRFGHVTSTVKPGWEGTNILGRIGGDPQTPAAIQHEANGEAPTAWREGAGESGSSVIACGGRHA